jgi:PleD family two-component response regulator
MKDMSILNPEGTSRGVRVLLVDDQRMVGEAVRRMVQGEEGIEFKYCQNPEEAVAVAEEFRPTVILQDLVMPGIDGLSLVEIYKDKRHPETCSGNCAFQSGGSGHQGGVFRSRRQRLFGQAA